MRRLLPFLLLLLLAARAHAQAPPVDLPPGQEFYSTFSIIAHDPATGELGIGVQSRAFRAGAAVPWAEAGVGAVATQAAANQSYGPRAMELLKEGKTPEEVVEILVRGDPGRDNRQVAVIDAQGRAAVYTGASVLARPTYAGHQIDTHYSVQGNTLAGPQVVAEMARAYEETEGEMAERLMASLEAGQAAGGDARGMQSGGILVVRAMEGNRTTDRWVDIRVDDADDPFRELRRLLDISLAGRHAERAVALKGEGKLSEAIAAQERAARMNPRQAGYLFTLAELYAEAGRDRPALNTLRRAIGYGDQRKGTARESEPLARFRELEEFQTLVAR